MNVGYSPPLKPLADVLGEHESAWRRRQLEALLVTRRGANGRPLTDIPWPVLDIRRCDDSVDQEFVKYLVKDAERTPDGQLAFMDPQLYARIYEGLEGIRTIQPSRGFWSKDSLETGVRACAQCGQTNLSTQRRKRQALESDENVGLVDA